MIVDPILKKRMEAQSEHGEPQRRPARTFPWVLPSGAVLPERRRHVPLFCDQPGCLLSPGHKGICLVLD